MNHVMPTGLDTAPDTLLSHSYIGTAGYRPAPNASPRRAEPAAVLPSRTAQATDWPKSTDKAERLARAALVEDERRTGATLAAAAEALTLLASEHTLAGRSTRRAEALAWRATTLRVLAETEGTASACRRAHSAARIARVAADEALTLPDRPGPEATHMGEEALARSLLELGLTALAMGAVDRSPRGALLLDEAARQLDEARLAMTALGRRVEARRAELSAIEARARSLLRAG